MDHHPFALLVYHQPHPVESLKPVLRDLSVETCGVRTCEEAGRMVGQTQFQIVFTDTSLPDGSWMDVVKMGKAARCPVDVIVVGAREDTNLYLSALEEGAFDFVLPPFEHEALEFIVESAQRDLHRRTQPAPVAATSRVCS
jgi:DNA-binding NtrC family response regulator